MRWKRFAPQNGLAFHPQEIYMKKFGFRPVLAGVALALATATAFAATTPAAATDGQAATAKHHGWHHHRNHGGMHSALMVPGVGPIGKREVRALKLTAAQQTQFDAAKTAQMALRKKMRESFHARRKAISQQLAAGKLDPHALVAQSAQGRDAFKADADKVRNQWLAVWDSLNDGQRQQVVAFMKKRQAWMKKHHGWRGHGDHHAMHGHGMHHRATPASAPAASPAAAPATAPAASGG
jgi:protein CpxP